jgi:hypothetical protein
VNAVQLSSKPTNISFAFEGSSASHGRYARLVGFQLSGLLTISVAWHCLQENGRQCFD